MNTGRDQTSPAKHRSSLHPVGVTSPSCRVPGRVGDPSLPDASLLRSDLTNGEVPVSLDSVAPEPECKNGILAVAGVPAMKRDRNT